MIKANHFLNACKSNGFGVFSGTPCSILKPLINGAINDSSTNYMAATNEGDAVAIVCGAALAGKKGIVMFQNSGLGNAVNAITSLAYPFRIPFLMIVTYRGEPDGPVDEPQHELMGRITGKMLDIMEIPWEYFPDKIEDIGRVFQNVKQRMEKNNLPCALLMRKNVLEPLELDRKEDSPPIGLRTISFSDSLMRSYSERATRADALKIVLKNRLPSDIIIATTGKTGRELYELEDSPSHFYMVGSMGSASSFALGLSLNTKNRRSIVLDGDGAIMMRMGNLASVGFFKPSNFIHLLLDNEVHDSTGGQETHSQKMPFALLAKGCGYKRVYSSDNINELSDILSESDISNGPTFIHFKIRKGSPTNLGRPNITPEEVARRLKKLLEI